MYFSRFKPKRVKGAATLKKLCPRCANEAEHYLSSAPLGAGIGLPFMRPWTPLKQYVTICPVCGNMEEASKEAAQALIARGKPS